MSDKEKKTIFWISVFVIAIVITIIWGFLIKKDLFLLKTQLQQKKEPNVKDLQFKENLEELKKSLENVQQGISDIKIVTEKENAKIKEQKLSPAQKEELNKKIKEAIEKTNYN